MIKTAFNDDPVWQVYNLNAKKRYLELLTIDKEKVEARLKLKQAELQAQIDATKNAQTVQEKLADDSEELGESNKPADRDKEGELLGKESNAVKTEGKKLKKVQKAIMQVNKVQQELEEIKKRFEVGERAMDYAQQLLAEAKLGQGIVQCINPETLERIREKEECQEIAAAAKKNNGVRKDCRWNQLGDYSCTIEKPPAVGLSLQEFRAIERARVSRKAAVQLTRQRLKQQSQIMGGPPAPKDASEGDADPKQEAKEATDKLDLLKAMTRLKSELMPVLKHESDMWGRGYRLLLEDVLAVQNKWLGDFTGKETAATTKLKTLNEERDDLLHKLIRVLVESFTDFRKVKERIEKAEENVLMAHEELRNPVRMPKEEYYKFMMTPDEHKALDDLEDAYKEALRQLHGATKAPGTVKDLKKLLHKIEVQLDTAMHIEENLHEPLRAAARKRKFQSICELVDDDAYSCPASSGHRQDVVSKATGFSVFERIGHLWREYVVNPTEVLWGPFARYWRTLLQYWRLYVWDALMGRAPGTIPVARKIFHEFALWEAQNADLVNSYFKYEKFYQDKLDPTEQARINAIKLRRRVKRRITKTERQIEEGRWVATQADHLVRDLRLGKAPVGLEGITEGVLAVVAFVVGKVASATAAEDEGEQQKRAEVSTAARDENGAVPRPGLELGVPVVRRKAGRRARLIDAANVYARQAVFF